MRTIKTITLLGAGNVANHLGKALLNNGFSINQVYSKSIDNTYILASELNAMPCDDTKFLTNESDLYLVCIKDDFIEEIVNQLLFTNKMVAHTSGSVAMDILSKFDNYGILYPLQTFSKDKEVTISDVPFCIEANNATNEQTLLELGKKLSNSVHKINSEQRKTIHLAAVFACNFSNHMYAIAENILTQNNLDFSLLKPLILETAKKVQNNTPSTIQTGPAIRNDDDVIKNQLEMLADSKDYQDIYKLITDNIIDGKL
ncbi:MAG: oxidoreductase [Flavobacteriales bacterium]|nr:MAG: oxidoreductase [Flavobacteriales bacterium]